MLRRRRSIFPVEAQYDAQRHSDQALGLVQLQLDPVCTIEEADALLRSRASGSRPGAHRLLTIRRDAMRALAAELAPTTYGR